MEPVAGLEAFAEAKRVIVVAAHPDDLECLCAGTLVQLIARGVAAFSVNCTLGDIGAQETVERSTLAAIRLAETEAAAQVLGLQATYNLGHPDGELVPSLALRAQLARLYRLTQADTLLTFDPFWRGQIHPDHRAAGQAALDAFLPSKMPLYHPEQLAEPSAGLGCIERVFLFATDPQPDVVVDVTGVYAAKTASVLAHRSQFPQGEENLEWLRKLDSEAGHPIGAPYAEAYRRVTLW